MEPHTNKCHVYLQLTKAEIQQSTGAAYTIIRSGDTTKYRSRLYNNTKAEIQQSTGAAEYRSIQGGDTTKYRSRRIPTTQGGDTTKYRSRRYIDYTRRRYNKVPEPPIYQYKSIVQIQCISTGGWDSRRISAVDAMTIARILLQYHDTKAEIHREVPAADTVTIDSVLLQYHNTKAEIHRRVPTADTVTVTLHCYNNTEAEIHQEYQQPTQLQLLCTVTIIPRPRYTKSTNSRRSYSYSALLQYTPRPRYTKSTNSQHSYNYSVLLQ